MTMCKAGQVVIVCQPWPEATRRSIYEPALRLFCVILSRTQHILFTLPTYNWKLCIKYSNHDLPMGYKTTRSIPFIIGKFFGCCCMAKMQTNTLIFCWNKSGSHLEAKYSSVQFILLTQESLYRPMSHACNILKQANDYKHTVTVRITKTIWNTHPT